MRYQKGEKNVFQAWMRNILYENITSNLNELAVARATASL